MKIKKNHNGSSSPNPSPLDDPAFWEDPSNWQLPPEHERKPRGKRVQQKKEEEEPPIWGPVYSQELRQIALLKHSALLTVLAELIRLHFKNHRQKTPFVFRCSTLGFNRITIWRALIDFEIAGWISVQRRQRKSPLVTILKGLIPPLTGV
jgi:hypothetical protein